MFSHLAPKMFSRNCRRCCGCAYDGVLFCQPEKLSVKYAAGLSSMGNSMTLQRQYSSSSPPGGPQHRPNWTDREIDFTNYSKSDLQKLDRRSLQLICKSLRINASLKTSMIIKNVEDYMDTNSLSELSFFPFHTNVKSDINICHKQTPLSIKLKSETCVDFDRVYESKYVSVTSVLRKTKSKENLKRLADWKEREVDQLGEENFNKMAKKTLSSGSTLHKYVATWLREYHEYEMETADEFRRNTSCIRTQEDKRQSRGYFIRQKLSKAAEYAEGSAEFMRFQSILNFFYDIDSVLAVESGAAHKPLGYAGTIDCIVKVKNKICLIDWKTSKRRKTTFRTCYDYPVQLVAYAAAVNADPAYDFAVNNVAVVFASEDDLPASVLMLSAADCLPYYYEWQGRLAQYKKYMNEREYRDLYVNSLC